MAAKRRKKDMRMSAKDTITKLYRKEWEKKLARGQKKQERDNDELNELIAHVGYDDTQLGREK